MANEPLSEARLVITAEGRAHAICALHNAAHPDMPNVPIQTVYEWLVEAQRDASEADQRKIAEHEAALRLAQQALWWRGPDRDEHTARFTQEALAAVKERLA